jgi:integrase
MESLFGWAHHAERIPIDPAWRLGQLVRIRRTRTWQPHWLTETQIAALLRRTDGDDLAAQRDRTLLMLGLFAGLRTGELHRLSWRNIHVDAGVLEIVGKGAKPASIVAAPQLRTQLEHWYATVRVMFGFSRAWPVLPILEAPHGDKRDIVVREPIKPLSIEGIRRVVKRHGNAIGIAFLRPHDLRRTLAGILDARSVPLHDIRLVMRHDTLDATQAYLADNPLRARRHLRTFTIEL